MLSSCPENVTLESTQCPNSCNVNDIYIFSGYDRLHGVSGYFNVVQCVTCGLQRTNPRPTAETIGFYYPDDYAPYHVANSLSFKKVGRVKKYLKLLLGVDARKIPPISPGRMLELGCASGAFMEEVRAQGWSVEGVEFSDSAAEIARGKGFLVQTATVENAQQPEQLVDVIAAWMVLEHLHAPITVLSKLRSWVRHDGYLIASVPDASSLAKTIFNERCYDWQLPTHLFHYTPRTLEIVLNNSGWTLEKVVWQKNCNTLLNSAEYWAVDFNHHKTLCFIKWLKNSHSASYIRLALGWILGVTRQSGRIEVWARPK